MTYYMKRSYVVYGHNSTTGREDLQAAGEFGCRNKGGLEEPVTIADGALVTGASCVAGSIRIDYKPDAPLYSLTMPISDIAAQIIQKSKDGDAISEDFVRQAYYQGLPMPS